MSILFIVLFLVALALGGVLCFTFGMLYSINALVIAGIVCISLFIICLTVFHFCFSKYYFTKTQVQTNPGRGFTTNNMNSMKRNKSDTDLELINRETKANTVIEPEIDEQGLV
jgi:hypothetical protein